SSPTGRRARPSDRGLLAPERVALAARDRVALAHADAGRTAGGADGVGLAGGTRGALRHPPARALRDGEAAAPDLVPADVAGVRTGLHGAARGGGGRGASAAAERGRAAERCGEVCAEVRDAVAAAHWCERADRSRARLARSLVARGSIAVRRRSALGAARR